MKICVINGSPRGKYSTTVHTLLYLQKRYPGHEFAFLHVGTAIGALEKDPARALETICSAELLIFSYPVYTFICPSQLHRFVALLKASGADLRGKFVTQVTTSKHFYDITAHRYIEENCFDLGMKVIKGLSQDMEDLTTAQGQLDAEAFFEYVLWCVQNDVHEEGSAMPKNLPPYRRSFPDSPAKKDGFDTVIVADCPESDRELSAMIEDFQAVYPYPTRLINLAQFRFKGGCLGCFNCIGSGQCIYKDGFDTLLREKILTADAVVYAFTVRDHSMGTTFKTFDDRQFCNGHRTVSEGKPFAYLVNGDLSGEENLKTILTARAEVGHNFLAGIAADAQGIAAMSSRLSYALEHRYLQPRNFYGVGGMKIFRDLIYTMQGLMKADHLFYKAHGLYNDFPQNHKGKVLAMYLVGTIMGSPRLKQKMGKKIDEGMAMPYKKVVDSAQPKSPEKTAP